MARVIKPSLYKRKSGGKVNTNIAKTHYVQSMSIIARELTHDGLMSEQQRVIKAVSANSDLMGDELFKIVHVPRYEDMERPSQGKREAIVECDYLINYLESVLALATSAHNSERRPRTTTTESSKQATKSVTRSANKAARKSEPTYCSCNRPYDEDMVACDNPKCEIEWFHLRCVGLGHFPSGKWLCPECR